MTTAAARAAEAYTQHTCQFRVGLTMISTAAHAWVRSMIAGPQGRIGRRANWVRRELCSEEGRWAGAGSWELELGHTYPGVHGQAHLDDCSPGLEGIGLRRLVRENKRGQWRRSSAHSGSRDAK